MSETTTVFSDGRAYEQFMGRWSRAIGQEFLDWLAAPKRSHWLDVGCGTGVFSELILDRCDPSHVTGVDPSKAQVDYAKSQRTDDRIRFQVADAQSFSFRDETFDYVASALVINFIPDRPKALGEMRRVCKRGGTVAGYVWNFKGNRQSGQALWTGLQELGYKMPDQPGINDTSLDAFQALFQNTGLESIATLVIDVTQTFASFDTYWQAQTPAFNIVGRTVAAMSETELVEAKAKVRGSLQIEPDGQLTISAQAIAAKGIVPL